MVNFRFARNSDIIHDYTYCQRFGSVLRLLLHPTRSHRNREGKGELMSRGRTETTHKPTGAYIMWAGSPYAHVHIMGRP
jgi:hypothetical protein